MGIRWAASRIVVASAYYLYNHLVTHVPSYALRHAYLRRVLGVSIGKGSSVHMGCFFTGRRIAIGDHTVVNRRCYLDGRAELVIGSRVNVSPECYLLSMTHDPASPDFRAVPRRTVIGDYAWLGARVMVTPGAEVGEGAVVGAGGVVAKRVGPYEIAAGVPARKVGERPRGLAYTPRYFPLFDTDESI